MLLTLDACARSTHIFWVADRRLHPASSPLFPGTPRVAPPAWPGWRSPPTCSSSSRAWCCSLITMQLSSRPRPPRGARSHRLAEEVGLLRRLEMSRPDDEQIPRLMSDPRRRASWCSPSARRAVSSRNAVGPSSTSAGRRRRGHPSSTTAARRSSVAEVSHVDGSAPARARAGREHRFHRRLQPRCAVTRSTAPTLALVNSDAIVTRGRPCPVS